MHYLFFVNTPAHVHLYKHVIERLRDRGHETTVMARDYGCTIALLDWEGLDYTTYGRCGTTRRSLFRRLPAHYLRIARSVVGRHFDLVFGMGAYSAHAGLLSRSPVILLLDSEPTGIDHAISTPFAKAIVTPAAFRKSLGSSHYTFEGFKESAYLHPDVFEPSPSVRADLGVGPDEPFVIVRLNAFGSHHDVGQGGFTPDVRGPLLERLADHATVFVSDEAGTLDFSTVPARPMSLHPGRIHDALHQASLLVTDTQTMATEAALLGTPTVRSNSFVGDDDMGNFLELEAAGLLVNVPDATDVADEAVSMLDDDVRREWRKRREEYVGGMANLSDLVTDVAESPDALDSIPGLTSATSA